jgi:hypothetical protein
LLLNAGKKRIKINMEDYFLDSSSHKKIIGKLYEKNQYDQLSQSLSKRS